MKKIWSILLCACLMSNLAFAVTPWEVGKPAGTDNASDLDTLIQANNTANERLVSNYKRGAQIEYLSASTLTVTAGEVCVSNSTGTDREYLQNASSTTVTWANIDTGTEEVSTTYYVYAYGSSSDDTFSFLISKQSSTPSGVTQYLKLGSFYNDSSGNITLIKNINGTVSLNDYVSRSQGVSYQATTDGFVIARGSNFGAWLYGYTDKNSTPTTLVFDAISSGDVTNARVGMCFPVIQGHYYRVVGNSVTMYWIEMSKSN